MLCCSVRSLGSARGTRAGFESLAVSSHPLQPRRAETIFSGAEIKQFV
jgi:hypothetical protein